jgi:hypothetical protein
VPLPKYNGPTSRPAQEMSAPARYVLPFVAALALLVADEANGQRVTGPWEDASIAPRGILRIGISPRFEQWKERYDRDGSREPLGASLTRDSLGPQVFRSWRARTSTDPPHGCPRRLRSLGSLRTNLDVTGHHRSRSITA